MFCFFKEIKSSERRKSLVDFLQRASSSGPWTCILFAYKVKTLDIRILLSALQAKDLMEDFQKCVLALLIPCLFWGLSWQKSQAIHLQVSSQTKESFITHGVSADVTALIMVFNKVQSGECNEAVIEASITSCAEKRQAYADRKACYLQGLKPLIKAKALSNSIASKLAGSGLTVDHLNRVASSVGKNGVKGLFGEKLSAGKLHIKQQMSIIDAICSSVTSKALLFIRKFSVYANLVSQAYHGNNTNTKDRCFHACV